ncbi:MAG: hypothetical protein R2824_06085 [Saprospiraceae bacterium]|nr:hypothetical protein [Lewinella sp.]
MPFNKKSASEAGKRSSRKGIPNGSTAEMKSFYTSLLTGQQSKIEKELQKLTGKDYLQAILKLSEFVVPKMRDVKTEIDVSRLSDSEVDELLDKALNRLTDEDE